MLRLNRTLIYILIISFLLISCKSSNHSIIENEQGISVSINDLDCCDDFKQQALRLDPHKEVVILVHGCKASSGNFTTLKEVFEARGQQAICFSYDYRDSIEDCSGRLLTAVKSLTEYINPSKITIIGHSQGALVSRRALISNREDNLGFNNMDIPIRLVTISGPFNGIEASSHCGITALHVISGGITVLICQAIAGSTWSEINPSSDFINNPGQLSNNVYQHLKINTDELDTCRSYDENGNCIESDYVFSLDEQYAEVIDNDIKVINVETRAGHAQIVGTPGNPPFTLISILENHEVLNERSYLTFAEENAMFLQLYK